jgi:hypothetical protein
MDVTFRSQPPDYSSARTDPPPAYLSPPNIVLHDEAREIEKSGDLRAGSISLNRVTKYIVTGDVIAYEDVEVDNMCHFQIRGNAVFGDDLEISSNSILEVKGDAKFEGSVVLNNTACLIIRGMATFEKQLTAKESSTCVVYRESNFKAVTTLWGSAVYFIEGNAKFQEEPEMGYGCETKGLQSQEQLNMKVGSIQRSMALQ